MAQPGSSISIFKEFLAFCIWPLFSLPIGVIYATFLSRVLGRNLGVSADSMPVVIPVMMVLFSIIIWLPVWGSWRQRRRIKMNWRAPFVVGVLASGVVYLLCSDNCFRFDGPQPFMAYFIVLPMILAAFLHDKFSRAWLA
jgi:hypothetical protein